MKRIVQIVAAGCAAAVLWSGGALAQDKSLYQRLGGYDAIAAVSDDFIGRLLEDKDFSRFFAGFSDDSKMRIRQNIVDFICNKTGGPCFYVGRDMKTAHAGMGVKKAEWDKAVQLFGETLKKFEVQEQEQKDLSALILPLEKDIVESE